MKNQEMVEHLQWLHDRMVYQLGQNKNMDYMIKFREIIEALDRPITKPVERGCGDDYPIIPQ